MSIVGDPYEFHLPAPNEGVTIPGIVTTVDDSGNVLSAMPLDADTGGSSGSSGVVTYYEESIGEQIITPVAVADLPDIPAYYADPASYLPLPTPVSVPIVVPAGASVRVMQSYEAKVNAPDPVAANASTSSIIKAPPITSARRGGEIFSVGEWRRSVGMDVGYDSDVASVPAGTIPSNIASGTSFPTSWG
jgi:hypothetical protein